MKICIRVDDFGWTPDEAPDDPPMKLPDKGLALTRRFHDAMGGLPYLGAVIPYALDAEGSSWLSSCPAGLTTAIHGWNHRPKNGVRDEFHGMSLEQMRYRLDLAQKALGGSQHFVPPFNALEELLPEACWHEGVRYIWGRESDWYTPDCPRALFREVVFIPAWKPMYGALGWDQGSGRPLLDELQARKDQPGLVVLTLHLTWEAAKDPTFENVKRLREHYENCVSPSEYVLLAQQRVAL